MLGERDRPRVGLVWSVNPNNTIDLRRGCAPTVGVSIFSPAKAGSRSRSSDAIAYLSGALGKRTWVLLPFNPDWRWLLDRDDSPWYRTAKLYRQKAAGDWNEVFARIATDLDRKFR